MVLSKETVFLWVQFWVQPEHYLDVYEKQVNSQVYITNVFFVHEINILKYCHVGSRCNNNHNLCLNTCLVLQIFTSFLTTAEFFSDQVHPSLT